MKTTIALLALVLVGCGQAHNSSVQTETPVVDFATSPKNKVLNGDMNFDQRQNGGVYTSAQAEVYSLDQWRFAGAGAGQYTIQQVATDAPSFTHELKVTVTRSQTSVVEGDNQHIEYPIEGRYIADQQFGQASAKDMTISFLVRASSAGVKPFAIMNGTNSRSFTSTYTVAHANEWTEVEIKVPGDVAGQWVSTDGSFGLKLLWSLGVMNSHTTAAPTDWHDGANWNVAGTDQLILEGTGATLEMTGVQFEIGASATAFDYLDQTEELQRLQRYFRTNSDGTFTNTRLGGS